MAGRAVYAFEGIDEATLPLLPLSARRALDAVGRKLSLPGWSSLSLDDRRLLAAAGVRDEVDPGAAAVADRAVPPPAVIAPSRTEDAEGPPPELVAALGPERRLDGALWRAAGALGRYALSKYASRPEKLAPAYDEIARTALTHLTAAGAVHMVGVGGKAETARRAVASARMRASPAAIAAIAAGSIEKGDVLAAARIAGLLACKRTPELVPLCHPVRTTRAEIDFELDPGRGELRVRATVEAVDRTGVEMEAMVAASVASLTAYDMVKALDRWASIASVRLEEKSGGKSGSVRRPPDREGA
ncbi:MAG: cyclic pyranopterin monophosphate synthase MoaC [Myxococcales bacterium]|nr:cyclic pyranopterin monophosphate synthase MoaC [Myxococcales bacterium]